MSHRDDGWDEEPEYDFDPEIEDYEGYDDEDGQGGGSRRTLMLLSVVALLVVFAGVVFLAYRQGTQQGPNGAPPVLRADGEPTKELPENPGGKKFPHQDAGVYNRIAGEGEAPGDGEQLLPPAEEPLAIDNPVPSEQDQQALDRMAQSIESNGIETAPIAPVGEAPAAEPVPEPEAPATPEVPESETPAETAAPAAAAGGAYVVQLAALRDEASARATFERMQSKYPDLLGGLSLDIQRADLGDKGIYYRARAGYMDKTGATSICEQLQARGGGCIVRER